MNTLKVLFAAFVMLVSFAACSPNHDEEVVPRDEIGISEQFKIKSEENGSDGQPGKPNPD